MDWVLRMADYMTSGKYSTWYCPWDRKRICHSERKALWCVHEPQLPLNLLPDSPAGIGVIRGKITIPDVHQCFSQLTCILNKGSLEDASLPFQSNSELKVNVN